MQRKPGFPVANCSIKMPDCAVMPDALLYEEDSDQQQRRQQLINFGHSQWGFNNWNWSVSKQELDFVDFANGKYCAGVVAFVTITVKSFDIHRENIGYATTTANTKGFAIYKSRKCAVTNALRETLMSFGGSVASELTELLDEHRVDAPPANAPEPLSENNQNVANKHAEPKNVTLERAARKEADSASPHPALRSPLVPPPPAQNGSLAPPPAVKNAGCGARVMPGAAMLGAAVPGAAVPGAAVPGAAMPSAAGMPPANRPPAAAGVRPVPGPARPNSNLAKTFRPENEHMVVDLEPPKPGVDVSEEEARAERKRRQRQAQEEFRQKQLMKQQGLDDKQELGRNSSSFDHLLMEIPTQDIMIEATGDEPGKRKSPGPDVAAKRRNSVKSKLDIVKD